MFVSFSKGLRLQVSSASAFFICHHGPHQRWSVSVTLSHHSSFSCLFGFACTEQFRRGGGGDGVQNQSDIPMCSYLLL